MPDLKNRYTDPELNPANSDFDAIVNKPDMRALDDRGDAIARDLKNSENNPDPINSDKADTPGREKASDTGYYQPKPKETGQKQGIGGWSRRKKAAALGGTAGVGGTIFALIFALLPLKVPGMMSMVTDHTTQRVEQIAEKRGRVILGRAVLTKFGTHSGIVITGEGAFATLMASMQTNRFEKKLADKGLVITETKDGVRLTHNGKPLGGGRELKDERAILAALDSDKLTNRIIKDMVREQIPAWRWVKKAKFAKWLRIKYNVPRFGLDNSNKDTPEEREKDVDAQRAERAATRLNANFSQLLGCIMGGSCDAVNDTNATSKKADQASSTESDITGYTEQELAKIQENGLPDVRGTTDTITKSVLKQFGAKAIPVIGWIDIVATLDHFAHEAGENDYLGKVAAYYKGASYAAVYAEWSGYASQVQLGGMDPEYVGVLADELNGAEKAQAYQAVVGADTSKGTPIEAMVNSNQPSNAKQLYDTILNSPVGLGNKYIGHPILNAYYETIGGGGFLGWAGNAIGGLLSTVLGPISDAVIGLIKQVTPAKVEEMALDTVSEIGPYILKTFGLTIDALDTGAGLMNNIIGGGTVSANEYCKEAGCRKLTNEQTYLQNSSIAAERAGDLKEKGVMYALFNTEDSRSAINQLAIAMPTDLDSSLSAVAHIISSAPSRILGFIAPHSYAAKSQTVEQLYGVSSYGATSGDLDRELSREMQAGEDCPEVAEGAYNSCAIDLMVVEAMLCEFEPESEACSDTVITGSQDDEGDSGTPGEWSLPVAKSGWESDGNRWLESHYEGSDAWTNSTKSASDINIGSGDSDCGVPVYSMLSGTIVGGPPGYTMQVKSNLNSKEVLITYAHGKNMKTSGTVSAGEKIMEISNNSRYGGTCHLHLEIKYGDKPICPQLVLPLVAKNKLVDLEKLPTGTYACK